MPVSASTTTAMPGALALISRISSVNGVPGATRGKASPWRIRRRAPLLGEDNEAVYGALGVSGDTPLESMYREARAARIYDGPDEVHRNAIAKMELGRYSDRPQQHDMAVTRF